jgi:hypothetical protein
MLRSVLNLFFGRGRELLVPEPAPARKRRGPAQHRSGIHIRWSLNKWGSLEARFKNARLIVRDLGSDGWGANISPIGSKKGEPALWQGKGYCHASSAKAVAHYHLRQLVQKGVVA